MKKTITLAILATITLLLISVAGTQFLSEPQHIKANSESTPSTGKLLKTALIDNKSVRDKSGDKSGGKQLLRINTSQLKHCNGTMTLDEQTLLSLPQQQFTTSHTWSEQAETFSGPLLKDVLNLACSSVTRLMLKAINDYAIEMDFNAMQNYQPIIALSVDGKRLSVRNKGPLWIMIPLDKFNELPARSLDDMLIWQLSDITILSTNEAF